jgi:hypothetical protein
MRFSGFLSTNVLGFGVHKPGERKKRLAPLAAVTDITPYLSGAL